MELKLGLRKMSWKLQTIRVKLEQRDLGVNLLFDHSPTGFKDACGTYLTPPQRTQLFSTVKIAWHHLAIEKLGDNREV